MEIRREEIESENENEWDDDWDDEDEDEYACCPECGGHQLNSLDGKCDDCWVTEQAEYFASRYPGCDDYEDEEEDLD